MNSTRMIEWILASIGRLCGGRRKRVRKIFGSILAFIMLFADRKRYAITLENISKAFPEKNKSWIKETVRAAYSNLGIVFTEIAAFPYISDEIVREMISFDNLEIIAKKYVEKKGLIFLSGHFGNWELMAYAAGIIAGIPITIVVKPPKNNNIANLLNRNRTRGGNLVIPYNKAAKTIMSTLKQGRAVAMLADQAADADRDIFVNFFGRPAVTHEAPAALALRLKAPIIFGFAVREPSGKYKVHIDEIQHDDLIYSAEGINELTRRHAAYLEMAIREYPHLWVWQHKRWKYAPSLTECGD